MKLISVMLFALLLGISGLFSQSLPANWSQKTIGQTTTPGSATYANSMFTVSGAGADIWYNQEEFHFVYTPGTDSIEIIAKIESIQNINDWSKAGIAIRQNDLAKSVCGIISYSPNLKVITAVQSDDGNGYIGAVSDQTGKNWLRLVYKNGVVAFYCSSDGVNWTKVGLRAKLNLTGTFCVGLVVSSHMSGTLCKTVFSNVTVKKPASSVVIYDGGKYFEKKKYTPETILTFAESKPLLPEPVIAGNPEWVNLYWVAWQMAFNNFKKPVSTSTLVSNWLDEAFSDEIIVQWDMIFASQFAKYGNHVFPAIKGLDNFYANQHPDGLINRCIIEASGEDHWWGMGPDNARSINPPLYAWGEFSTFKITSDTARLASVLPPIEKYFEWVETHRRGNDTPHKLYWSNGQAAGMDNTPRDEGRPYPGDGWDSHSAIDHQGWVDISSQLVIEANSIASICDVLGYTEKAQTYRTKAKDIGMRMNQWMWNEADGLYYDVDVTGKQTKWKTIASFWPLLAGITDTLKEAKLIANMKNPASFWREIPIPSLAADQNHYKPKGNYWEGGVWSPTNYALVKGLQERGYHDLARIIAEKYITGMSDVYKQTNTIWELYAPDKENGIYKQGTYANGADCGKNFVGWSALGPISMLIEDVIGLDVDAPNNTVTWQLTRTDEHGLKNLRFENITASLVAQKRTNNDSAKIDVTSTAAFKLKVNFNGKVSTFNVVAGRNTFICKPNNANTSIKSQCSFTSEKIYPNPASNNIKMYLPNNELQNKIDIFDISGKKMSTELSNSGIEQLEIDVNKLNSGVCLVSTENSKGKNTQKLIINK